MTTYILGAGPTGMAIADGLTDANDHDFVVFERGASLGGLAQTLEWGGVGCHDLGPHKIFSLDRSLVNRVEKLLPATAWLTREKISSIYLRGHYLSYPPSPFSLARVFGIPAFARIVAGYAVARLTSLFILRNPRTFEEDLVGRLGLPLYQSMFKPIAEKLWGNPQELDAKLSRGRVQTPSFGEVMARLLKLKRGSDFEALTFRYPAGGLAQLWNAIRAKGRKEGRYRLQHTVTRLVALQGRIREIHYASPVGEGVCVLGDEDFVVSTLPLALTTGLLGHALPAHLPELARKIIVLNDLLLVFFHVNRPSLLQESWVFVPDSGVIFNRLSEQESFDPAMTPNGSIVCCEIMSGKDRPIALKSDAELIEAAAQGLRMMGYADFEILAKRVIRLPQSYPIFRPGFETGLAEIVCALDCIRNYRTVGRQGAFNYIGTLDAMDIGYGFARWLANGMKQPWVDERARTRHYPVLD